MFYPTLAVAHEPERDLFGKAEPKQCEAPPQQPAVKLMPRRTLYLCFYVAHWSFKPPLFEGLLAWLRVKKKE